MLQRYLCMVGMVGVLLLFQACVKEDLSKISDEYNWKPSSSLPLRSIVFTAADLSVPPTEIDSTNNSVSRRSIDFEFSEIYTNSDYVDSVTFRMDITNSFPTQLKVSAYYMNGAGEIIRNIISPAPLIIKKPLIDESGSVSQAENVLYDDTLNKADISSLEETKSIQIIVLIEDFDQNPAVLDKSDEWSIDISIGLRSAMNVPIEEI